MASVPESVEEMCLSFPETEVKISHGAPTYTIRGKSFAIFSLNHHGDGKVALLMNASRETQQMLVNSAPKIFFVPPYIGSKGWVGVELNKGLAWNRVLKLSYESYCRTAPKALMKEAAIPVIAPPDREMTAIDINPLKSEENQALLSRLSKICLALPEVIENKQFGNPNFKAGGKSFCNLSVSDDRATLQIWVGPDRQISLTSFDKRFRIPAYVGTYGWINLDLSHGQDWTEIKSLVIESFKHFALKRMLAALC